MVAYVVLIVIGVAGFYIGKMWWDRRKYRLNKIEVIGKVLCEFAPISGGQVTRELLEEYQGIIKRPENTSKATFFMPAKATEKTEFTEYHALPEHEYLDVYPIDAARAQQVIVRKFYFNENDPSPRMPHDASRWTGERYIKVSSSISKDARNESSLRILTTEMSGVWTSIENAVVMLKKIPTVVLLTIVNIGITVLMGFFLFLINQNIGKLATFWLGE